MIFLSQQNATQNGVNFQLLETFIVKGKNSKSSTRGKIQEKKF